MTHELPVAFEIASLVAVVAILVTDLAIVRRRPHVPSVRESVVWVLVYVALALAFAGLLAVVGGAAPAEEFVAGWLTEYSLSVDNLFVFLLIMSSFAVPRAQQQRVLMVGIIVALVLRAGFILAGAAIIERYTWVFYVFGAFLVWTAVKLARGGVGGADEEYEENALVRAVRRVLPMSPGYDGGRVRTEHAGRRVFTPLVVVFVAIGTTDVLFAFDSIPAIFGLTHDPFIVFTANVFALMGLRQLYFLLGGLLDRLVYLPYGLAAVLAFIGVKLVLEALATNSLGFVNGGEPVPWAPEVPTWVSLAVIAVALGGATVASLVRVRRLAGRPPGTPPLP
ncbi:TerC family protein [Cellulomonas wangsupingiae]|uniref:TerC family protein n=1 Tax=Cellulomonas wangsupingiae TaxID=2968085 RepID=A0ABY5JZX3_9CELL|nr:TerC family protein [Cellulomonas wangsupingiae]MCC2333339.1 TerC family protein [Cellulomonas wangsupingiae]MCM0638192.1 TerC family protein [Cellulomonas wangsupingiae]UUI63539.1 TerC family protein [Cellulomonas wangsupingiae]